MRARWACILVELARLVTQLQQWLERMRNKP